MSKLLKSACDLVGPITFKGHADGGFVAEGSFGVGGHSDYQQIKVFGIGATIDEALQKFLEEWAFAKYQQRMFPDRLDQLLQSIDAVDAQAGAAARNRIYVHQLRFVS